MKIKFKSIFRRVSFPTVLISFASLVIIVYFGILIFDRLKQVDLVSQRDAEPRRNALINQKEALLKTDKKYTTTDLIEKNEKYIVQVFCNTYNGDVQASGVVIGRDKIGNLIVLTNYHVIENFKPYTPSVPSCVIHSQTKEWSEFYYGQPTFYPEEITKKDMELIDFALITVKTEPRIKSENIANDGAKTEIEQARSLLALGTFPTVCSSSQLKIGEDLIVLGFPDVSGIGIPALGSTAKFTATEGIISEDISSSAYYFNTSAKIEYGNSGGGAFLKNSGCLAGLPTFVRAGELESLGRILNANKLQDKFLNNVISSHGNIFEDLIKETKK